MIQSRALYCELFTIETALDWQTPLSIDHSGLTSTAGALLTGHVGRLQLEIAAELSSPPPLLPTCVSRALGGGLPSRLIIWAAELHELTLA